MSLYEEKVLEANCEGILKGVLEQRKRTSTALSQSASRKLSEKAQVLEDLQETLFPSDGSLSSVTAFAALSASRTKTFESAEERLRSKLSASSSAVDASRQRFVASQKLLLNVHMGVSNLLQSAHKVFGSGGARHRQQKD